MPSAPQPDIALRTARAGFTATLADLDLSRTQTPATPDAARAAWRDHPVLCFYRPGPEPGEPAGLCLQVRAVW